MEQDFDTEPNSDIVALAARIRATPVPTSAVAAQPEHGRGNVEFLQPADATTEGGSPPSHVVMPARVKRPPSASRFRWSWIAACTLVLIVMGYAYVSAFSDRSRAPIRKIAVLPLANLTGDPSRGYFVAGLHDALIAELAKIKALTVYSRQSMLRYQGSDLPLP